MSRKIVILERINEPSDYDFRFVLRATYNPKFVDFKKDPNRKSILADAAQDETDEMIGGLVEERLGTVSYKPGMATDDIKADLESKLVDFQAEIDSRNPFKLFGTSFDGTKWTDGGVV